MHRLSLTGVALLALVIGIVVAACSTKTEEAAQVTNAMTQEQLVERGKYLTWIAACNDCHTPKIMTAQGPIFDSTRWLSGHPAEAGILEYPASTITPNGWTATTNGHLSSWAGPWGISFAANLTPDQTTGIGAWTEDAFVKTIRSGKHLGMGRDILPPMPWQVYSKMTDEDLRAVFAYLKSLPPIMNQVPQPIAPSGVPASEDGASSAH